MSDNFSWLKKIDNYRAFADSCVEAEQALAASPKAAAVLCRAALESAVKWIYAAERLVVPRGTLKLLVDNYQFADLIDERIFNRLRLIIRLGNFAAHENKTVSRQDALLALGVLFDFVNWIDYSYGSSYKERSFDENLVADGRKLTVDLERLNAAVAAKQLENEALLKKLAQMSEQLVAGKTQHQSERVYQPQNISEHETRKRYIDFDVHASGFTIGGDCTAEYEVSPMPNKENRGYADYVLWGDNGKPLALIEAKKTSADLMQGVHQARLYADALEIMHGTRPLIFLSNGAETWLHDDAEGYPVRKVYALYHKEELESLLRRRGQRGNPDALAIKDSITNRLYQKEAVKAAVGEYRNKRRAALWIMATGAGKTRTAVSLVDVLTRSQWVKNVLFLADRRELVKQARASFKDLLPDISTCNLMDNRDEKDARIVFSTYQTIINAIDAERSGNGERLFGVARFDLIIIDEAHRSIFKKYRAIFAYFDALLLGMTATPKSEVDRNTYEFFNVPDNIPTYDYPYQRAIEEGVLVPYKSVEMRMKFPCEGIRYDELTPQEQDAYEQEFSDEDGAMPEEIPAESLNSWLFNNNTVDIVLHDLFKYGVMTPNGEAPGKSIIFAANHNHAVFIKQRLDILYPQLGGQFAEVIDNKVRYSEDLIGRFKAKDSYPQLAVSVDMLDTGIDVPEIVNLVFFKRVRSRAKFWQMIGRGTRICPELFGNGKDKQFFRILDCCGNFEFFRTNPDYEKSTVTASVSERTVNAKAAIVKELQHIGYQDTAHQDLRQSMIESIAGVFGSLPRENFAVHEQRVHLDHYGDAANYQTLEDRCLDIISGKLAPLVVDSQADGQAQIFDLAVYSLMLARLQGNKKRDDGIVNRLTAVMKAISKLGTIPQVAKKAALLAEAVRKEFWEQQTITGLENARIELRSLVQFLPGKDKNPVYTDFADEITGYDKDNPSDAPEHAGDDYEKRVQRYVNEHRDNVAIYKLTHNQTLTAADVQALEQILWSELGSKADFEQHFPLLTIGKAVRKISGLDEASARAAFSELLDTGGLSYQQLNFLKLIVEHITRYGYIEDKALLTREPFRSIGQITDVFPLPGVRKIVEIIDTIERNAG